MFFSWGLPIGNVWQVVDIETAKSYEIILVQ